MLTKRQAGDEQFYIRYSAEGVPLGDPLQGFCSRNKIPSNPFIKWYRDTRHKVVPVTVDGMPENLSKEESADGSERTDSQPTSVRIMIDIRMTKGLHVNLRDIPHHDIDMSDGGGVSYGASEDILQKNH